MLSSSALTLTALFEPVCYIRLLALKRDYSLAVAIVLRELSQHPLLPFSMTVMD